MSNEDKLDEILEQIVYCQDCGGYVSDHNGVQGDCNYEAGTEIVDKAKAELTKLIDEETTKARVDEIDSVPRVSFGIDGYVNDRLTELKERENSNE